VRILYRHRTRSKEGQYAHIEETIHALREQGHEVVIVAPPSAALRVVGLFGGLLRRA
jgi:hypothetical protein